jgi:uncharacterized membrane-anchored protein YhcB (DUF1043 family)
MESAANRTKSVSFPNHVSTSSSFPSLLQATLSPEIAQHNQLFPIPAQPKLKKILEAKPISRISPGYDMRTVRKQIEQLRQEIVDHVEVQGFVYNQNEILWNHFKDLFQVNDRSSTVLYEEVDKLNRHLETLFFEKARLADELRDAQEMVKANEQLEDEENLLKGMIFEAEKKQTFALEELQR